MEPEWKQPEHWEQLAAESAASVDAALPCAGTAWLWPCLHPAAHLHQEDEDAWLIMELPTHIPMTLKHGGMRMHLLV